MTLSTFSGNSGSLLDVGGGDGAPGGVGGIGGDGGNADGSLNSNGGDGGDGGIGGAGAEGGNGGVITLTMSTVSGNSGDALNSPGGSGGAGGIAGSGGRGRQGGPGGNLGNDGRVGLSGASGSAGTNGLLTLTATILAANGQNCVAGTVVDDGYNLSTDGSCTLSNTGSQTNVDPNLGTLGDYGGPTQTIPLLPGSSAIDAVPTGTASNQTVCLNASGDPIVHASNPEIVSTDQRGVPRPQGDNCDIGAYEVTTLATSTVAAAVSVDDTATSVTLNATVTVPTCAVPDNDCGVVNQGAVTFHISDPSSNPVGTDVSGNVTSGSASASWTVPSGVVPGSYTITASYHDPAGVFTDSQGTNTLTVTGGPAESLSLSPGDTSVTVDSSLTETATVTDAADKPVADGTSVTFVVTGSNPTTYTTTTVNGQASFTYSSSLTGTDTLTATASGGTSPSDSATINWTSPNSTARASLTIINPRSPLIFTMVQTNSRGGTPTGRFIYVGRNVTLSQVQITSLVVSGQTATLYGSAQLADGTPVDFRLDATTSRFFDSVRLRLSNGYDSGTVFAMEVLIGSGIVR